MSKWEDHNNGYRYILTVIDIFSRYAWARALKQKTGPSLVKAFESIFKEGRIPKKLWVDEGKEFINKEMKCITLGGVASLQ